MSRPASQVLSSSAIFAREKPRSSETGDQPQPGQVRVVVPADPPLQPRGGQQPPLLVQTDVARGRPGGPGEIVDADRRSPLHCGQDHPHAVLDNVPSHIGTIALMSTMTLPAEELEWRDGREKVATRLLKATADKSYDPDVDIDWALDFEPDKFFISQKHVSLYDTPLWDRCRSSSASSCPSTSQPAGCRPASPSRCSSTRSCCATPSCATRSPTTCATHSPRSRTSAGTR